MNRREKYGSLLLFVGIVLVLSAYLFVFKRSGKSPESSPYRQRTIGELPQEPIVPAGYQKIAPAPADNSKEMLGQTSTIFRGSLKDVQFTYDGCAGPRTEYVFSNSSPLLGE